MRLLLSINNNKTLPPCLYIENIEYLMLKRSVWSPEYTLYLIRCSLVVLNLKSQKKTSRGFGRQIWSFNTCERTYIIHILYCAKRSLFLEKLGLKTSLGPRYRSIILLHPNHILLISISLRLFQFVWPVTMPHTRIFLAFSLTKAVRYSDIGLEE